MFLKKKREEIKNFVVKIQLKNRGNLAIENVFLFISIRDLDRLPGYKYYNSKYSRCLKQR